jgi:hypothetical protein
MSVSGLGFLPIQALMLFGCNLNKPESRFSPTFALANGFLSVSVFIADKLILEIPHVLKIAGVSDYLL